MGFFDNLSNSISDAINQGSAATSRTARTLKLKSKLSDLTHQRADLAAQLGASLYDATKDDPAFTAGRESLYEGIAAVDDQRAALQAQLTEIEAQAEADAIARKTYTCPVCGTQVKDSASFCPGCGKPVSEIRDEVRRAREEEEAAAKAAADEAARALICPNCGAIVGDDDKFCQSCGKAIDREAAVAKGTPSNPIVEDAPAPVDAIVEPVDDDAPAEAQPQPAASADAKSQPVVPSDAAESADKPQA